MKGDLFLHQNFNIVIIAGRKLMIIPVMPLWEKLSCHKMEIRHLGETGVERKWFCESFWESIYNMWKIPQAAYLVTKFKFTEMLSAISLINENTSVHDYIYSPDGPFTCCAIIT